MGLQIYPCLILFVVAANFINCETTSLTRATFGEACDKGIRCDSRASLSCIENTCQCVKPDEMTYSKRKGKCVVLSGERCSYTAVEILTDQTQEKRWTERLDCVDNANCNNEGYCDCRSEFYEDSVGACVPKLLNGQNCTQDNECRTDKNLMCVDGFCSCNQSEAVYDPAYNQCVARAGATCLKYERCVRNAFCPRRHGHGYYGNGQGTYDQCTCSSEYKRSKSGLCLAKYEMSCDVTSAPCSEEFSCTNGKCNCHFPGHQFYNRSAYQCVSFVRGPCSEQIEENTLEFPCVLNSECKNQKGIHECVCKDGYIESEDRKCSIAHGQTCGDTKASETCDKVANLVCKNGKCACPDFQIYDNELTKCRGLVGSNCILNASTNFCVEGATCQSYRDSKLGSGVCQCKPPAVPDSQRKCTSLLLLIEDEISNNVINGTVESMEDIVVLNDSQY